MGFREAEFVARCAVCKDEASDECVRCARPLCDEHRAPAGERCGACEADYAHRTKALTKPAPKKLKGAFNTAVVKPSIGFGLTFSLALFVISLVAGAGFQALTAATVGFIGGAILGLGLTLPAYVLIGSPLFARRKLHEPIQRARRYLARKRFMDESAKLGPRQAQKQLEAGNRPAGDDAGVHRTPRDEAGIGAHRDADHDARRGDAELDTPRSDAELDPHRDADHDAHCDDAELDAHRSDDADHDAA